MKYPTPSSFSGGTCTWCGALLRYADQGQTCNDCAREIDREWEKINLARLAKAQALTAIDYGQNTLV